MIEAIEEILLHFMEIYEAVKKLLVGGNRQRGW
jgi:hypothetical protein